MSPTDSPLQILNNVAVATPCSADWNEMEGDEASRFCQHCFKRVYNLSAMTAEEAVRLIQESETTPCVRLYRRQDGTLINRDCPRGIRRAGPWLKRLAVAILVTFLSSVTIATGVTASLGFRATSAKIVSFISACFASQSEVMGQVVMGDMICVDGTNGAPMARPPAVPVPESLAE